MNDKTGKDPAHPNLTKLDDERFAQREKEEAERLSLFIQESYERTDALNDETSRMEEYYGVFPQELPKNTTSADAIRREITKRTKKLTRMIKKADDSVMGRRLVRRANEEIQRLDSDLDNLARFASVSDEFHSRWKRLRHAQEELFLLVGEEEFRRYMFTMAIDRDDDEIEDSIIATRGRVFGYPRVTDLSGYDLSFLSGDEDGQ